MIAELVAFFMFVAFVSTFSFAAAFGMQDHHLLSFYRKLLERLQVRGGYAGRIAKPLGLCPVCFSFWVGVCTYALEGFEGRFNFAAIFVSLYVVYRIIPRE